MRFTNNRLTRLQADKTLLCSIRLCQAQLKNIVKLLLCKFDQGVCGGLCGKGDQGLVGRDGRGGGVGQNGQGCQGGWDCQDG